MQQFLNTDWITAGGLSFTYGQVLGSVAFVFICLILYWFVRVRFLPAYFQRVAESAAQRQKIRRSSLYIIILVVLIGLTIIADVDLAPFQIGSIDIRPTTILQALLILQLARVTDWLISKIVLQRFYENRREQGREIQLQPKRDMASRAVQIAVYILALIMILRNFNVDYELFQYIDGQGQVTFILRISNLLTAILVLVIARLVAWLFTEVVLHSYFKRGNVPVATQYAFNQILKYIIFTAATLVAINQLGVNTTLLVGGLAALLVGVGLGLQQTFNDFFSGIILLFERSVDIGDVLDVNGTVGTVRKIGMRASQLETRDNVTMVVPNSLLVTQNVVNWSHLDNKVRFFVPVSVAYGSDPERIKELLLKAAATNTYLLKNPAPFVRLVEFGASGLNFELHFWSRQLIVIEDIKSDLRMQITALFNEADITIPFTQTDIWIRTDSENPE